MKPEKLPKVSEMSDVLVAKGILIDTFDLEVNGRSLVIGRAISSLKRLERSLGEKVMSRRERVWTERRVRSIIDEEARRIDAYEIEDLKRVQLEEARHDFQRSAARAARLAAMLTNCSTDFHGPEIEAQMAWVRGLVGPGGEVPASPETGDSSGADSAGKRRGGNDRTGNWWDL